MGKRRRILLAALVVAVLGALACVVLPAGPREPVYEGKSVSYWLRQPKQYFNAHMDSNAVPFLAQALKIQDGPLKMTYLNIWRKMPRSLEDQLPMPVPATTVRMEAAILLSMLGNDANRAVPALILSLKTDENNYVRILAAQALGKIGWNDSSVTNALVESLKDKDPMVRATASQVLNVMGLQAAAKAGVK